MEEDENEAGDSEARDIEEVEAEEPAITRQQAQPAILKLTGWILLLRAQDKRTSNYTYKLFPFYLIVLSALLFVESKCLFLAKSPFPI